MLPQRVNIYDGTEFVRLRIDLRWLHLQGAILLYGFFKEDRSVERVSRVNGRLSNSATLCLPKRHQRAWNPDGRGVQIAVGTRGMTRGEKRKRKRNLAGTEDVYELEDPDKLQRGLEGAGDAPSHEPQLPDGFEDEEVDENAALEPGDEELTERFRLHPASDDELEEEDHEEDEEGGNDELNRQSLVSDLQRSASASARSREQRRAVRTEILPEKAENACLSSDPLSIQDLIDAAGTGEGGANGRLRKRLSRLNSAAKPEEPPLPERVRAKQERKAAYERSAADVAKWQGAVQANRKARSLDLRKEEVSHPTNSTVGSIASDHAPTSVMEREVSDLLKQANAEHGTQKAVEEEDAEQLERMSFEEAKRRKDRLAKMRALLFKHEERAKRLKRTRSKANKRRERKSRRGREQRMGSEIDEDEARKAQEQAEFDRAKERMTLKHRNTSRWAKRSIRKGLNKLPGTKEAINEQLRIGEELMERVNRTQSQRENSDEPDADGNDTESEDEDETEEDKATERNGKYKEKEKQEALDVISGNADADNVPSNGLFSLPFMRRAMERKQDEAKEEAKEILEDAEADEFGDDEWHERDAAKSNGQEVQRESPDVAAQQQQKQQQREGQSNFDHKQELEAGQQLFDSRAEGGAAHAREILKGHAASKGESAISSGKSRLAQSVANASKKTTAQVTDNSTDVVSEEERVRQAAQRGRNVAQALEQNKTVGVSEQQRELISQAFADDDVADEFAQQKEQVLYGELPSEEAEEALPGWGEWASKQRGAPKFIQKQREADRKKREEALKKRRDARKPNVILSERYDRLAAQHSVQSLPHPHNSREAFDASMRVPIGRDYNSDAAFREFTRPEVLQQPGQVIKPIAPTAKAQ